MVKDIVEEFFALVNIILHGLEHTLLLFKLAIEFFLTLVVVVKLANRRLLQLVQLAQRVNFVLRRVWCGRLFLLVLLVVMSAVVSRLLLLQRQLFLRDRVLRVLMYQVLVVDLVNHLLLVSDLLPFLFLFQRNDSLLHVQLHLPNVQFLMVLNYILLCIERTYFVLDAPELVA